MNDQIEVEEFHGVYKIRIEHSDMGSLWAHAEQHDVDIKVAVRYNVGSDDFELSGQYNTLTLLASSLMAFGEAHGRLRYVVLSRLILDTMEDTMDDIAETARWN